MNSRERLLAALRCQPVDRIPWCPLAEGYVMKSFAEPYRSMREWDFLAEIGADLWIRLCGGAGYDPPIRLNRDAREFRSGIQVETKLDGDLLVRTFTTPVGTLREARTYTPQSPNAPFPVERLIKTVRDVETWTYVMEHTRVEPAYGTMEEAQAAVGDRGLICAQAPWTPIQGLLMFETGVEQFYYLLEDHPSHVETLLAAMHEVFKENMRVLGASPAEVVITYENTSTTLESPDIMRRYEFPALDDYADIVHRAGKLYLIHMCGRVNTVIDIIAAGRFDAIVDIAVPPTGDCDLPRAREKLCAVGKGLAGGIDATAFVGLTPDQMEEHVATLLRSMAPGTGFILDSGDAVPFGTPIENLKAVSRAVERYGKYPIE
ncbi:MAG: hypothetical protein HYY04_01870 [Chloroflexi bacterium]|nr:hypothetical protein [Chloroflexota bacterium]